MLPRFSDSLLLTSRCVVLLLSLFPSALLGWTDGWVRACMNGWMNGWMDEWMDG